MNLKAWASAILGMPDEWTALQFDAAVIYFGRRIENMLNEMDKEGKPKHKLEDLIKDGTAGTMSGKDFIASMKANKAMGEKKLKKKS